MSELAQYDYDLPRELIAQTPSRVRADARLLLVRRDEQSIAHHHVRDLPELLSPGDCLVLNDTKVIPARVVGYRTVTGGHFEGLFLESSQGNIWRLMGKTRGKLHPGEDLTLVDHDGREAVRLTLRGQQPDGTWVAELNSEVDTFELLEQIGRVPLPPYIRGGEMTDADRRQYQTVYAERPGAVAAPTAGLHFTAELLGRLQQQGVSVCRLTLHVGPGTFRPITADRVDQHRLDPEWGELDAPTVERINRAKNTGRVIAVGTTSVRVLETAGTDSTLRPYRGHTDLYIHPPYQFKVVDALMTNFHLPRTTLLVLVRTFGGDELIRRAYEEAIAERYRFYSYGDSMLIL